MSDSDRVPLIRNGQGRDDHDLECAGILIWPMIMLGLAVLAFGVYCVVKAMA